MRVLQITAFSGWGCTGRIALGIHNVMVAQGHESVIAWGRINNAPAEVPTIQIGNKFDQQRHGLYTRITDKCGFGSRGVTKEFLRKLDDYNPELIQLHIMHGYYINLELLFTYIKQHKIPVVWTFHDCWAFTGHCPYFDYVGCEKWQTGCHDCQQKKHHPASWLLDNSAWNYKKKKELFTGVNNMTIVTPSEWLTGLVKKSFLKEYPVVVINNGINLNDFKPTEGTFRQDYGIKDKKIVLGVSSTWVKSKGIDDFIEMSKMLPDDYIIILVGLNKDQKESLPRTMIGIERTDSVQKLAEIYTAADVFVNPTYEDNYPTTNLEALACGTPVITYRTGGSIEAVQYSGHGFIVEKGNVAMLVGKIVELEAENPKKPLYKCSDIKNNEAYIKIYANMLGDDGEKDNFI